MPANTEFMGYIDLKNMKHTKKEPSNNSYYLFLAKEFLGKSPNDLGGPRVSLAEAFGRKSGKFFLYSIETNGDPKEGCFYYEVVRFVYNYKASRWEEDFFSEPIYEPIDTTEEVTELILNFEEVCQPPVTKATGL